MFEKKFNKLDPGTYYLEMEAGNPFLIDWGNEQEITYKVDKTYKTSFNLLKGTKAKVNITQISDKTIANTNVSATIGSKTYRIRSTKIGSFTIKISSKLVKGTKIKISVTKTGYTQKTITYLVK